MSAPSNFLFITYFHLFCARYRNAVEPFHQPGGGCLEVVVGSTLECITHNPSCSLFNVKQEFLDVIGCKIFLVFLLS